VASAHLKRCLVLGQPEQPRQFLGLARQQPAQTQIIITLNKHTEQATALAAATMSSQRRQRVKDRE
jgi:hypothetical protein